MREEIAYGAFLFVGPLREHGEGGIGGQRRFVRLTRCRQSHGVNIPVKIGLQFDHSNLQVHALFLRVSLVLGEHRDLLHRPQCPIDFGEGHPHCLDRPRLFRRQRIRGQLQNVLLLGNAPARTVDPQVEIPEGKSGISGQTRQKRIRSVDAHKNNLLVVFGANRSGAGKTRRSAKMHYLRKRRSLHCRERPATNPTIPAARKGSPETGTTPTSHQKNMLKEHRSPLVIFIGNVALEHEFKNIFFCK